MFVVVFVFMCGCVCDYRLPTHCSMSMRVFCVSLQVHVHVLCFASGLCVCFVFCVLCFVFCVLCFALCLCVCFVFKFGRVCDYGVATVSRIDKIIGLFCRISSLL